MDLPIVDRASSISTEKLSPTTEAAGLRLIVPSLLSSLSGFRCATLTRGGEISETGLLGGVGNLDTSTCVRGGELKYDCKFKDRRRLSFTPGPMVERSKVGRMAVNGMGGTSGAVSESVVRRI